MATLEPRASQILLYSRFEVNLDIDVVQNRFVLLCSLNSKLLNSSGFCFSVPSNPPRPERNQDADRNETHCHCEWRRVLWLIFGLEDLGANCESNLTASVGKGNGKCGSSSTVCRLDSPGPHHRVPAVRTGICNDCGSIYTAVIGKRIKNAVAC